MENTKQLSAGDIVFNQGYEFKVVRAWRIDGKPGLWHYVGECTASERNDSIRGTGYNGGVYSWRAV